MELRMLKEHWPIISAVAAGLVAWGVHGADIAQLKKEVQEQKVEAKTDHDLIVSVNERTKYMADDMKEIKESLKELTRNENVRPRP